MVGMILLVVSIFQMRQSSVQRIRRDIVSQVHHVHEPPAIQWGFGDTWIIGE